MPSRKVARIEITRHTPIEGTRRESWIVDSKYLHKFDKFTEWFAINKSYLTDRTLKSDSSILDKFVNDMRENTGDDEDTVWRDVISEICHGDSSEIDDDVEYVYGASSEHYANDTVGWQHYVDNSLVTESDTEPEPEPELELGRVDGTWMPPEPVVREVVAEPMTAQDREANFVSLCNRQAQFIPEDTTIRVTPETLGLLMGYACSRWNTGLPSSASEIVGRDWYVVSAVLKSRELWIQMCHLIDRKCYDMGLSEKGVG